MSLDRFEKMTQREKDEFSKICNKLMSATYMLRDGTDKLVSREYRFIENEFELFSDYLSLGGWKIYKDAQYGIIYVRNVEGYNKLALNKLTTVMLITMRIIYEDMRVQASNTNDVSDREVLAQVGIIMMSEIFEFCGNVRINFVGGTVDFSPIKNGACVLDESVSDICSIDIFDTDKIIFIENKTNYTEYCLNRQTDRELVVYHGGFYSPKHGEFFRKLCDGKDIPTYLWSDIDYGGFRMFMRLKKNIVPSLEPLNMNIDSFERYKEKGLKRDDKYIMTLQKLTEDPDYSVFYEVISAIINSKVTVEQECFLEKEKC